MLPNTPPTCPVQATRCAADPEPRRPYLPIHPPRSAPWLGAAPPSSSSAAPARPAPAPSPSSESSRSSASGAVLASSSSPPTAVPDEEPEAAAAVRTAVMGKMPKLIPCPPSEVGAERIHSNDNKNDDTEQIKLVLTTIQHCLASIDKHLKKIVDFHALIDNRLTAMMGIPGFASPLAITQGPSTAAVITGTPANEEAVKRMKGLLGSMCSIADKLPMFCGPVLVWLLSNSGQNSDNPWMQVIVPGSLMMCFISFILLAFTSKFKERESIDGVLFQISIWLLLPVFFALWPGLCMILHLFTHTSKFILWPLGALFSIISVSFWYLNFYKEHQKILEELKGGCVPENVVLPENPKSEAASAQGLQRDNSYTVQITDPSVIPSYALSK